MQRYFTNAELEVDTDIEMNQDDSHHIKNVMRMNVDDTLELVDNQSKLYLGTITNLEPVQVRVTDTIEINSELPVETTLYIPLLKGDKLDWLLQKATEMGASSILLYEAERAVVKLDHKKQEKRLARFEKIVKEASEQSKRLKVPEIRFVGGVGTLPVRDYDAFFIAYEGNASDQSKHLSHVLTEDLKSVACIFGPEGGFSDSEVEMLSEATSVRLGPRILRAETAPLYFLSALSVVYE